MRYYFHIVNSGGSDHQPIVDGQGMTFARDEDAMAHAGVMIRELARDPSLDGFTLLVVNERGMEIGRLPLEG
jgi:hypothetical protein